jgi:uncharacterized membrane protein YqaE (UPF0057 family)
MKYLFAIILPPFAVLACGKPVQFFINVLLTLCYYFPGMLHALFVVSNHNADKRNEELIKALRESKK